MGGAGFLPVPFHPRRVTFNPRPHGGCMCPPPKLLAGTLIWGVSTGPRYPPLRSPPQAPAGSEAGAAPTDAETEAMPLPTSARRGQSGTSGQTPAQYRARPASPSDFAIFGPVRGDSIANALQKVESLELSPLSLPTPTTPCSDAGPWAQGWQESTLCRHLGGGRGCHPPCRSPWLGVWGLKTRRPDEQG